MHRILFSLMPGLDPGIQKTRAQAQVVLDCRVKPGNEGIG